ncbi:hypothetical protein BTVI_01021 [Pitangus sulphuratus]|nr:hypothetical protein BTVI_01021 [Pitangus sulphuratus]
MLQSGVPASRAALMLEEALASRKGTISVIHINSHDPIKGFFQIGNHKADAAAKGLWTLRDACQLHESLPIGAKALVKECKITIGSSDALGTGTAQCQRKTTRRPTLRARRRQRPDSIETTTMKESSEVFA